MKSNPPHLSRSSVIPAELLPVSGFIPRRRASEEDNPLHELILRVNAGNLSYLGVPSSLVYRWACLCGRWAPDLQTFIAQVLRHTGNLDHFLVQPAALDHHSGDHGLLETSITAAEFAMSVDHDAKSLQPLPPQVDELHQVCSAMAFLFDIGKVFHPTLRADAPRGERPTLAPFADLSRCWRSDWKALYGRNPVLAGWMHHLGRHDRGRATPVRVTRSLAHNAIRAAWNTPSSIAR